MPQPQPHSPATSNAAALSAPNIVNIEDIRSFSDSFARRAERPEAKRWYCKNLLNFLAREPRLSRVIAADEIQAIFDAQNRELPDWVRQAIDQGRTLHWFDPGADEVWDDTGDFVQALHNVVDWMRGLLETDRRWRQFHKISVPDAIAAARAWHRTLARRAADDWPEDWPGLTTVFRFANGIKFVKLTSAGSLNREGRVMGHCVATYASAVADGASTIYSLRDTRNRPHVTIEIVSGHLHQVKGRANSFPAERWRPYIRKFVRRMGWSVGPDAGRLGLFSFCGRTYSDMHQLIDDLPDLPVLQDLPFDCQVLSPILSFLGKTATRGAGLTPRHQQGLLALLRASILATRRGYRIASTGRVAVDLAVSSIPEVQLHIAGTAFAFGELGLLVDVTGDLAILCRYIGCRALALITKHPERLYRLRLVTGADLRPGALHRFFAAAGLALEFNQVRRTALEHKRKRVLEAVAALRHQIADQRKCGILPEEARAKAWNTMRVQAPLFCERTLLEPDVA